MADGRGRIPETAGNLRWTDNEGAGGGHHWPDAVDKSRSTGCFGRLTGRGARGILRRVREDWNPSRVDFRSARNRIILACCCELHAFPKGGPVPYVENWSAFCCLTFPPFGEFAALRTASQRDSPEPGGTFWRSERMRSGAFGRGNRRGRDREYAEPRSGKARQAQGRKSAPREIRKSGTNERR